MGRCRETAGDDSGRRWELFHDSLGTLAGRSLMELERTRFRLALSMGCMTSGLNVAACLFLADLGSSWEKVVLSVGDDVKGVWYRVSASSDDESDGLSDSSAAGPLSWSFVSERRSWPL
jgi:hypothetical protein